MNDSAQTDQHQFVSIGAPQAVALSQSGFWQEMSDLDRARFQISVEELTMPFGVFRASVEAVTGEPASDTGLALGRQSLVRQLWGGMPERGAVLALIPPQFRALTTPAGG